MWSLSAARHSALVGATLEFGHPSQKDNGALLLTGDHRYDAHFQELKPIF
jgi:hypothetical protein